MRVCCWPLYMTAFKFFSVDGDKGNVLPFHIFFYFVFYGDFYGVIRLVWVRTGSEIGEKLSEWSNGLFMYVGMITGNLELLVLANRAINTPKARHTRERSSEEEKRDDSTRQQRRFSGINERLLLSTTRKFAQRTKANCYTTCNDAVCMWNLINKFVSPEFYRNQ